MFCPICHSLLDLQTERCRRCESEAFEKKPKVRVGWGWKYGRTKFKGDGNYGVSKVQGR